MTLGAHSYQHLVLCLCGLGGLLGGETAAAQVANATSAGSVVPGVSTASVPSPAGYQDRLIGGGTLVPDITREDVSNSDLGLAHSLQVDGVVSAFDSHGGGSSSHLSENGIVAKSQWDTATYGAWSLDASARTGSSSNNQLEQGRGGALTLRQRAMPFEGGWQADNALGDLNTPNINLARLQQRFYFPTATIEGLATEWRGPSGVQIVAGGGIPGFSEGIVVPEFRALSGSIATVGAQWSPTALWSVGGQLIDAHSANLAIGSFIDGAALQSSTTGLVTAAWQDHGDKLQFNLMDGGAGGKGNGVGSWVDGTMAEGRIVHNAGLFYIDPNLTWGNQLIANDLEGGYYRFNYHTRQWVADAGIDEAHSVSGRGASTTFLTGDSRYQLSRDWGIGSVADLSFAQGGTNWSLEGYVDQANPWGTGRAQVDFAHTTSGKDEKLTVDEAWSMPSALRLSTSMSMERISGTPLGGSLSDSTVLGVNVFGGGQFTSKTSLQGNVRWATAVQGRAAPGVSANVSMTYQLSPAWQILATLYDSRTGAWTPPTVVSPLTPPVAVVMPSQDERGIFFSLRYKRASGLHFAPLGGAPGAGSGEVAGIVYLDANNNGQLDAGEAGAPNVTVLLDGRFSVQTDANGRFAFPAVATGHHVISVSSDNLPLPWILVGDGRLELQVTTRDRTDLSIPAQRPR